VLETPGPISLRFTALKSDAVCIGINQVLSIVACLAV
jgi:hypothetical protein